VFSRQGNDGPRSYLRWLTLILESGVLAEATEYVRSSAHGRDLRSVNIDVLRDPAS
jgi:hypothetical protein